MRRERQRETKGTGPVIDGIETTTEIVVEGSADRHEPLRG
jgi:hypothetical protein